MRTICWDQAAEAIVNRQPAQHHRRYLRIYIKVALGCCVAGVIACVAVIPAYLSAIREGESALKAETLADAGVFLAHVEIQLTSLYNLMDLFRLSVRSFLTEQNLVGLFYATLQTHKDLFRCRLVSDSAVEMVRVENIDGEIIIFNNSRLNPNVSGQYYFGIYRQMQVANVSGPLFTPITLEMENNEIITPYQPAMRLLAAVDAHGVLIIAVNVRQWLEELQTARSLGREFYVLDERGSYMISPDPSQEWLVQRGLPSTTDHDMKPGILSVIFSADAGQPNEGVLTGNGNARLFWRRLEAVKLAIVFKYSLWSVLTAGQSTLVFSVVAVMFVYILLLVCVLYGCQRKRNRQLQAELGHVEELLCAIRYAGAQDDDCMTPSPKEEDDEVVCETIDLGCGGTQTLDILRSRGPGKSKSVGVTTFGLSSPPDVPIFCAAALATPTGVIKSPDASTSRDSCCRPSCFSGDHNVDNVLLTDPCIMPTASTSSPTADSQQATPPRFRSTNNALVSIRPSNPMSLRGISADNEQTAEPNNHHVPARASRVLAELTMVRAHFNDLMQRLHEERKQSREAFASQVRERQFLAYCSHDIRTPLHGMVGLLDLLKNCHSLSAEARSTVTLLQKSTNHLTCVLSDIVDLSRIQSGKIRLCIKDVHVGNLVRDVLHMMSEQSRVRGLHFEVAVAEHPPPVCRADPQRLLQIAKNFVSNALAYVRTGAIRTVVVTIPWIRMLGSTGVFLQQDIGVFNDSEPSSIQIRMTGCPALDVDLRSEVTVLAVSDSGHGLSPRSLVKMFDLFTQVSAPANDQKGSGLGLSICARLASLMQGVVGVASIRAVGAVFWVAIPTSPEYPDSQSASTPLVNGLSDSGSHTHEASYAEPDSSQNATTGECSNNASGGGGSGGISFGLGGVSLSPSANFHQAHPRRLVIICDDNSINRHVCAKMLQSGNFMHLEAVHGGECLARLEDDASRVGLVLLDMNMPIMDGATTIRLIRSHADPVIRAVPVVCCSAHAMQTEITEALAGGFDGFLAKPFSTKQLLDTVRHFICQL